MDKFDQIEQYFLGNAALSNFVASFCYDLTDEQLKSMEVLRQPEYYNAAYLGIVTNMLLNIKEDLIVKTTNVDKYNQAKIYEEELNTMVETVAKKDGDGYEIGGYHFKDAPSVFAFIRNKIAHGFFIPDFKNGIVYLKEVTDTGRYELPVNIKDLTVFVAKAFNMKLLEQKNGVYTRDFQYIANTSVFRTRPIVDKKELRYILGQASYVNISLVSNTGKEVKKSIVDEFWLKLRDNHNKPDHTIYEFARKNNCSIRKSEKKVNSYITNNDIDHIWDVIKNREEFYDQAKIIGNELFYKINPDDYYKTYSLLPNMGLLSILESVVRNDSIDKKVIENTLYEYGVNYIDSFILQISSLACFNSLVSFGLEDIYATANMGFDFGALDLSMIKPKVCVVEDNQLIMAKNNYNSKNKILTGKTNSLEELKKHLENVKKSHNWEARRKISKRIKEVIKDVKQAQIERDAAKAELSSVEEFNRKSPKYHDNLAIINGIRNSLAHGRYIIKHGDSFGTDYISFKDIDEKNGNKTVFECDITLDDFTKLIEECYSWMSAYLVAKKEYLNKNNKKRILKK